MGLSQLESSTVPYSEHESQRITYPSPQSRGLLPTPYKTADADTQAQLLWLGYQQELDRNWGFWPVFLLSFCNFGVTLTAFWGLYSSLLSGGLIIMTWGYLIACMFTIIMTAVLSEVASAYPVSGAMFTWTFKLARSNPHFRNWASFLSWTVGWVLMTSLVVSQMQLSVQFAYVLISGIRVWGIPWDYQIWHTYLIISAGVLICGLITSMPQTRSPMTWKIVGTVVIILHMTICLLLLATSNQRRKFYTIFTSFQPRKEFSNRAWTFIYGWSTAAVVSGTEVTAHMAEETRHASSTVPRAMFFSTVFSLAVGMIGCVASALTIIPLHHPLTKTWPIIDLLFSHLPKPAAQFVFISLLLIMLSQGVSQMLAATRFAWALARDGVLPYSSYWRQVTPNTRIPRRATGLIVMLSMLAAVGYVEESGRLSYIMIHLGALLTFAYLIPVSLYLSSPRGVLDFDGRNVWTLRQFGRPLAAITVMSLLLEFGLYCAPKVEHPTAATWPYAPFVMVGVILISSLAWILHGRARYIGPIKSITVWSAGQEVELPKTRGRPSFENDQSTTTGPGPVLRPHGTQSCSSPSNFPSLNIPNTYQTYASNGSMWCGTNFEAQASAITSECHQ
ncbi:hypothetical protein CROQUDRAFT_36565 [Cronartium quercuum f. sp. fusiforme G11]|uniref:Amino acid transporter n=1 Tax=Cronartium quercuum f. sp. fusiforme G11 TaxID=708437 RepID=A0A9P6TGY4_9BASI|nr:hypothetical protein CROQUDRAFT_36565 [Cronartium quercuum f. sp. fusiforme G11]